MPQYQSQPQQRTIKQKEEAHCHVRTCTMAVCHDSPTIRLSTVNRPPWGMSASPSRVYVSLVPMAALYVYASQTVRPLQLDVPSSSFFFFF